MTGRFLGGTAALVVDLGRGDVAVGEELLDLADVDAGVEEKRGGRGANRVGGGCRRTREILGTATIFPPPGAGKSKARRLSCREWWLVPIASLDSP